MTLTTGCICSGATKNVRGAAVVAELVGGLSASIASEVNAIRVANGQPALSPDSRLGRAAQARANDIQVKAYFSHTGQDGSSAGDRVIRQVYGFCFVAENISQGQKGAMQALASWQKSEGHRKNLLSKNVIHFGMAQAGDYYYVMVLGKPGC